MVAMSADSTAADLDDQRAVWKAEMWAHRLVDSKVETKAA